MRFEAKHRWFKKLGSNLNNYKNICRLLAERHQQHFCTVWKNFDLNTKLILGKWTKVNLNSFATETREIQMDLTLKDTDIILMTNSFELGFVVRIGFYICLKSGSQPEFGKIKNIFKINDSIFLFVSFYSTEKFDNDMCSLKIKEENKNLLINYSSFPNKKTFELISIENGIYLLSKSKI